MSRQPEFLPTTGEEMERAGYEELDILLITGDCYVDHPSFGVSIIGRLLTDCGYRVGLIAQPDWKNPESLTVMGRPRIGVGVTSGNMDSMVNIYTVGRRFRKEDCFSENGETGKRPPHALIVYAQMVKQVFPGIPVQLGGLEASFRRIAHYDYWQDKIRPSVLLDSKAEILVYGMGERPTPEVYRRFAAGESLAKAQAIRFEFRAEQEKPDAGYRCAYVMFENGMPYFTLPAPKPEYQQVTIPLAEAVKDPASVRQLRIGMNPRSERVTFFVRNIEVLGDPAGQPPCDVAEVVTAQTPGAAFIQGEPLRFTLKPFVVGSFRRLAAEFA